jgi:hypothetical protein
VHLRFWRRHARPDEGADVPLSESDLPALYVAADSSSLSAQVRFRRTTVAVLVLLVAAAVCGALPDDTIPGNTRWISIGAAAAFFAVVVLQGVLAGRAPQRAWYEGRALAESAKSLGWQFAVGGGRYPVGTDEDSRAAQLAADLDDLLTDIPEAKPIEVAPGQTQVTQAMRELRRRGLDVRRQAYRQGRIDDQKEWYASKAVWNRRRARFWLAIVLGCQLTGGIVAVLKAAGEIKVDLLGIASAITASVVAWLELRDHVALSEAYSLASHELSLVETGIGDPTDETAWSEYVSDAEQAISREHRMWRAARSSKLSR